MTKDAHARAYAGDSTEARDDSEMPFLDHLEELRWRIIKSVLALIVAFSMCMWLSYRVDVFAYAIAPIRPYLHGEKLVYTHIAEKFSLLLQISGVMAIGTASPVILYQVWAFLSPALRPKERRIVVPVFVAGGGLFVLGVATAVFVFVPVTMGLMESIKTEALAPMLTAGEYFGFLSMISLAFGALFELPMLVLALTALGLLTPKVLVKYRRHAFVGLLILCQVITPGDAVISTLVLFVPVYGLYELSIFCAWILVKTRERRRRRAERTDGQDKMN